jgi:hypothetical protein
LLHNIMVSRGRAGVSVRLLFDQTHLTQTAFTVAESTFKDFTASILSGTVSLAGKLALTGLALGMVAARFMYTRPSESTSSAVEGKVEIQDVDSILERHPTWNRATLSYVMREVNESIRLRRINEEE